MSDPLGTPLDVLALAAHPDDAELGCGGTLAALARRGLHTGILDLTRGEMGSRGTPELRDKEATAAASVLGLRARRNAGLPDGGIDPLDPEQRLAVVRALRELKPSVLLLPWSEARHPDHVHASRLGDEAAFRSGLHRVATGQEPFRPALVLYYMERVPFEPTLVADVSRDHDTKLAAIACYRSQFERRADDPEPATFLTRPEFREAVTARDRHYGELAGFRFGEPLKSRGPLPVSDLGVLLADPGFGLAGDGGVTR